MSKLPAKWRDSIGQVAPINKGVNRTVGALNAS